MRGLGKLNRRIGWLEPVDASACLSIALITFAVMSPSELRADPADEHGHADIRAYADELAHGHEHADELAHEHQHGDPHHNAVSPLTRARALQREHRFTESALVLAGFLEENPLHAEAQLLHADVLRHAGRIDESQGACLRVALAGATTFAGYCAVQILLEQGEFDQADSTSRQLAPLRTLLSDNAQIWALEISAEAAWNAGRIDEARQMYVEALGFDDVPHSTVDAFADFIEVTNSERRKN